MQVVWNTTGANPTTGTLADTTNTAQFLTSFTPSVTTKSQAYLDGGIQISSSSGSTMLSLRPQAHTTGSNSLVINSGSFCQLSPAN